MPDGLKDSDSNGSCSTQKQRLLRTLLATKAPLLVVGAHDAMTAQLIGSYGFDAVWVSSFGISTMAFAAPDMNFITMTEMLSAATRLNQATHLPVIADCDNGYGSILNYVRTVKEFEQAGIAGVCIEDSVFPKTNSLYSASARRELVSIDEQVRRIHAAKAAQASSEFMLIARIEALIAKQGVEEAIARAIAYAGAGADALLIQSHDTSLRELTAFVAGCAAAKVSRPLITVSTLCPQVSISEWKTLGFSMVLLANQPMRAAVRAIEAALQALLTADLPASVEPSICSVSHIFELVNMKAATELTDGQFR